MPVQPTATDAELVTRAAGGEQAAFTVVFERYVDQVHDHVARWSRDPTLAADATQEAFAALLRNLDTLRDGQGVLAWLLRTARARAIDQLRRTRPERSVAEVPSAVLAATITGPGASPEVAAMTHETAELVWDVAAGLDDRTFTVLDLSVRQGLSGPEIAAVVDTTPSDAEVLVDRMRERMLALFGAALLLRVPARDCETLEALRASAPEPIDLAAARRIGDHAEECVTCGPRRARAIAPLRTYAALAQVRAPVAVRSAVGAAAANHFGTAVPTGHLRRGAVGAIAVGVLLLVGGIAYGLRGPASPDRDGPPAVAAQPVPETTPTPASSTTLEPLPPASPLPVAPPEPTVAPSPEPSPEPSPSPSPSPSPIPLAITIEQPEAGASVVADRVDEETERTVGTVPVRAAVTASPEAQVTITWTSDLAPDTPLHTGADGTVELWLTGSCQDTTHQLRATATDADTRDTVSEVVPVTMTHTCVTPIEVEITEPAEDPTRVTAHQPTGEPGTYAATINVTATADAPDDPELAWAWTSDQMGDQVLLNQAEGQITLTVQCGDPVTHVVTATASAEDGSNDSDQVQIVVDPPPSCPSG